MGVSTADSPHPSPDHSVVEGSTKDGLWSPAAIEFIQNYGQPPGVSRTYKHCVSAQLTAPKGPAAPRCLQRRGQIPPSSQLLQARSVEERAVFA
ncbi:Steroidogenic Acute Regulatory Protein [Manis pentadactyla]|nr:Steroidogenic Acute Regulatory Protein [Manis pentadactyla]